MICAGSNQGFLNILLCLCNPGDQVILFRPYYFSHYTACLLAGLEPVVVHTDSDFLPPPQSLKITDKTKLVVVVSPGNPSGRVVGVDLLRCLYQLCSQKGVWLLIDEAYEHFTFDGAESNSFSATDGVINLYTFSKVGQLSTPFQKHRLTWWIQVAFLGRVESRLLLLSSLSPKTYVGNTRHNSNSRLSSCTKSSIGSNKQLFRGLDTSTSTTGYVGDCVPSILIRFPRNCA